MDYATFKALVLKFGGHIVNLKPLFHTDRQREQFEKAVKEYEENKK